MNWSSAHVPLLGMRTTMNKISKFQCHTNQIVVDVGDIIGKIIHELQLARGDQTACEGLLDKTNYHKADCTKLFHT